MRDKKATTREILGWTILLILGILVLVIFALWIFGDYNTAGGMIVANIMNRFIGIGI